MTTEQNNIRLITLLLTIVAGYCDTATFVGADRIFSAHVTGNFITFAFQLVIGSEGDAWLKLLTFPVFVAAVMIGGAIGPRVSNKHFLLFFEGIVITLAGLLVILANYTAEQDPGFVGYLSTMLVVFAMGLQNAFGKLYAKETYGPTTMMTGNVTQAALDFRGLVANRGKNPDINVSFYRQLIVIGGFLAGCLVGAAVTRHYGLSVIILPGIMMVSCYLISKVMR